MHFSKIAALLFASLATAGTISTEDSDGDVIRYKLGNNVWSDVAPETEAIAYKLGHNTWSSVTPGGNDAASQTTDIVAKRDDVQPTLDELKANATLLMEWMMAHKPTDADLDADLDGNEADLIARWDARWTDVFCRCVIQMSTCASSVLFNNWTTRRKIDHCLDAARDVGLCLARTRWYYNDQFGNDFPPQEAVGRATDQLFIDFTGSQ
ncbi:hypothetical protein E0Z10_g9824 [Xylaria hypoxylon]|uniref:Uncharacterized protein n=1 Tax=Xylaria hypoxylon TaxID=37992 RepID=A0A4Z0Y582_9PEZI|nr:hypothetical protein E0Z10_g9824 [Xylaria hypoxylon]